MMDLLISKIFFFISSATTSCGSGFSLTVEGGRFQDEAVWSISESAGSWLSTESSTRQAACEQLQKAGLGGGLVLAP